MIRHPLARIPVFVKIVGMSLVIQPSGSPFSAFFEQISAFRLFQPAKLIHISLKIRAKIIVIISNLLPAELTIALWGKIVDFSH